MYLWGLPRTGGMTEKELTSLCCLSTSAWMVSNNLSRALSCLRLSCHNFLVQRMCPHNRNRRPYALRICDKCVEHTVQMRWNNLTTWGEGFSFQHFSVLFLERTCWCTVVNQMLDLNSASNLFDEQHGSLMWRSLPPLGFNILVLWTRLNCLLWLSIRLFLLSQALPFIIHSSPLTHHFP